MMMPCEHIAATLPALFSCAPHDERVRIRTPFLYPDGDVVDLFYSEPAGVPTLTDLGETTRWLHMQGGAEKRTPKQRRMIEDVCITLGIEFFKGMLVVRVRDGGNFSDAVLRLGQASVRVADIWFTLRNRTVQSMSDDVAEFLAEKKIPFERHAKLVGRSSKILNVDFSTRTPEQSALVSVLTTGARAAGRGITEHVLTTWYDLNHLKTSSDPSLKFVSLFDDSSDVWTEADMTLLRSISTVVMWSRPDEFEAELRRAA